MRKGFTLIELIIVIVILGVLAGAMMPMFSKAKTDAQKAKVQAELEVLKTATLMFNADTNYWPKTADKADILFTNPDNVTLKKWAGPYVNEYKKDPWDKDYVYTIDSKVLFIGSQGPTKDGTCSGTASTDYCAIITSNVGESRP